MLHLSKKLYLSISPAAQVHSLTTLQAKESNLTSGK